MANRPVYEAFLKPPFYIAVNVEFEYFPGFSVSQKQKTIDSLHKSYNKRYPDEKVLEISSKSRTETGVLLSAFNLEMESEIGVYSVECAFQSSKVFENGGPFTDLLKGSSRQAKKDERLRSSGRLTGFKYFDDEFPLDPKGYFYNWLYINALSKNERLSKEVLQYDSFTDIEFNPQKAINCQAIAAATYVGLVRAGKLEEALNSKEDFLRIVYRR